MIHPYGPWASCALLAGDDGGASRYLDVAEALAELHTQRRLFEKPAISRRGAWRRPLARADTLEATIAGD